MEGQIFWLKEVNVFYGGSRQNLRFFFGKFGPKKIPKAWIRHLMVRRFQIFLLKMIRPKMQTFAIAMTDWTFSIKVSVNKQRLFVEIDEALFEKEPW